MGDFEAISFTGYEGILSLLAGSEGPIVACGQAVNFWAERYHGEEPRLESPRPFVSKDLDILGSLAAAEQIARMTESEIQRAPSRGATPVLANIHLRVAGGIRLVQVLHQIPGLITEEIRKHAIAVEVSGYTIHIADPITLLAGKIHNVAHFDQKNRNDIQHIKILCLCIPVFFSKLVMIAGQDSNATRPCLNDFERFMAVCSSSDAVKTSVSLDINWQNLIPIAALGASRDAKLRSFVEKRLKRWRAV